MLAPTAAMPRAWGIKKALPSRGRQGSSVADDPQTIDRTQAFFAADALALAAARALRFLRECLTCLLLAFTDAKAGLAATARVAGTAGVAEIAGLVAVAEVAGTALVAATAGVAGVAEVAGLAANAEVAANEIARASRVARMLLFMKELRSVGSGGNIRPCTKHAPQPLARSLRDHYVSAISTQAKRSASRPHDCSSEANIDPFPLRTHRASESMPYGATQCALTYGRFISPCVRFPRNQVMGRSMSEQRVAAGGIGKDKLGEAMPWQRTFPYQTRLELSRLLDELRASLPWMIERYKQEEDFWPAFRRAAHLIKAAAMGFNLDYVNDRINAMAAELYPDGSGFSSKLGDESSPLA